MLFRIAIATGRTVAEVEASLTAKEFGEWCAFYRLEPWGYEIGNWRSAMLASTIANFVGKPKKAFAIGDFLPRKKVKQTPQQMLNILRIGWGGK